MDRARGFYPLGREFKSLTGHVKIGAVNVDRKDIFATYEPDQEGWTCYYGTDIPIIIYKSITVDGIYSEVRSHVSAMVCYKQLSYGGEPMICSYEYPVTDLTVSEEENVRRIRYKHTAPQ